jgi:hypothetical protein
MSGKVPYTFCYNRKRKKNNSGKKFSLTANGEENGCASKYRQEKLRICPLPPPPPKAGSKAGTHVLYCGPISLNNIAGSLWATLYPTQHLAPLLFICLKKYYRFDSLVVVTIFFRLGYILVTECLTIVSDKKAMPCRRC